MLGTLLGIGAATILGGIIGSNSKNKDENKGESKNTNPTEFNEERWNNLIDKIANSLETQQYKKADSQLGNYYRQFENNEKDYWYFYYRSYIFLQQLEGTGVEHGSLKRSIQEAIKMAPNDEKLQEMNDLQERYENAIKHISNSTTDKAKHKLERKTRVSEKLLEDQKIESDIANLLKESSIDVFQESCGMRDLYLNEKSFFCPYRKAFHSKPLYFARIDINSGFWKEKCKTHGNFKSSAWAKSDDVREWRNICLSINGLSIQDNAYNNTRRDFLCIENLFFWADIESIEENGENVLITLLPGAPYYESSIALQLTGSVWEPVLKKIAGLPYFQSEVEINTEMSNTANLIKEEQNLQIKETQDEYPVQANIRNANQESNNVDKRESGSMPDGTESSQSPSELYREEVEFLLEDGEIGTAERKLLERKRIKYGLSEQQAKLIEESCNKSSSSLSELEQEYLEIYKEIVEDGKPTGRVRKMLDREAQALGLSPEQVAKVESMI